MKIELKVLEVIDQKGDIILASLAYPNMDMHVVYNIRTKELIDLEVDDCCHFALELFDELTGE